MEVAWVCVYFPLALVAHAVLVRLPISGNSVSKFVVGGGAVGLGLILHVWYAAGLGYALTASIVSYAFLSELYIFLFTMVSSSVSVQLLLMLRTGKRKCQELDAAYESTDMVARRVGRLLDAGLLTKRGESCAISQRGSRLVKSFWKLKTFFRHEGQSPATEANVRFWRLDCYTARAPEELDQSTPAAYAPRD